LFVFFLLGCLLLLFFFLLASLDAEVVDVAVDLTTVRPGDTIHSPYELTISQSFVDHWHSAFYCHDRISTSTPFARKLGLQDQIIPASLMLLLTGSMSHVDAAKAQVGFQNAIYHWPAFSGDTFTKSFQVKNIRDTSDGNHTIINFICTMKNQRGKTCMSTEKSMLWALNQPITRASAVVIPNGNESQEFRNHLLGTCLSFSILSLSIDSYSRTIDSLSRSWPLLKSSFFFSFLFFSCSCSSPPPS
jgi:hypothetical protein